MENFHQREYGAIETKEEVYFSLSIKKCTLAEFATTLPERQLTRKQGKWFMDEPSLPYSVGSSSGFKAHQNFDQNGSNYQDKENNSFKRRVCSKIESSTLCC
jgi:hypothetical protein